MRVSMMACGVSTWVHNGRRYYWGHHDTEWHHWLALEGKFTQDMNFTKKMVLLATFVPFWLQMSVFDCPWGNHIWSLG
jgi:hypothetical protein